MDISIIHRAQCFVVVDKPSAMLAVPGRGPDKADCVAARVQAAFPDATGPLVAHRLDMETSGLMVLGLDAAAQRHLSKQFEDRLVEKAYVALVDGVMEQDEGTIDLPIRADIDHRPMQIVDHVHGKPATTHWSVIAHEVDRTRLRLVPLTGRTHQLRVHCASGLGRPIIGDSLYAPHSAAPRLMLHATQLSFLDPANGRRVEFESAPPF